MERTVGSGSAGWPAVTEDELLLADSAVAAKQSEYRGCRMEARGNRSSVPAPWAVPRAGRTKLHCGRTNTS